ncbi:MAG: NTP transferase domain-containing protein [Paracoccaceae bacterium]
MKFGPVPLAEAEGALLAHSLRLEDGVLKKGRALSRTDVASLAQAGFEQVTVAKPDADDVLEDAAAARVAAALVADPSECGVTISAPFTGRANVYARQAGVLLLDTDRLAKLNAMDEALTVATLPNMSRVSARQMLATVKIIPYGLPGQLVADAEQELKAAHALKVHPFQMRSADVILTRTPGMSDKVVAKGGDAVRQRLRALGFDDIREHVVPHVTEVVAAELGKTSAEVALILTGSATSDRGDVGPAALCEAGGDVLRFGMPVDPGNLLFLGQIAERPVIGLPGCARSPKLNGADWVLERIAAGLQVTSADIAAMGVGGLLKEIPSRPQPRAGGAAAPQRPFVVAVLLAAGASSRMGNRDKLVELVDGKPLLLVLAERLLQSAADEVICVLPPDRIDRSAVLSGVDVQSVTNARAAEGMGTSIAAGITALPPETDAAVIVLGDMPEIAAEDIDRLIAAFDPSEDRAIVRAVGPDGRAGHPVLFGRRFFEALGALEGDQGARPVLAENAEFVTDVLLSGDAAHTDLDTPEDWADWRAKSEASG